MRDALIERAAVATEILAVRLAEGRLCHRLLPADDDDLDIDARLRARDVAAVYDALVETIGELQDVADRYGDAIGDPESLARVRRLRERREAGCQRDMDD